MSASENLRKSIEQLEKLGVDIDLPLLEAIIKRQGPTNNSRDASLVAASSEREKKYVVKNFISKKLQMDQIQGAEDLEKILEVMGQVKIRNKQRAVVYYALVRHYKKQGLYL